MSAPCSGDPVLLRRASVPAAKDCIRDARPGEAVCRFDLDFEQVRDLRNDTGNPDVTRLVLMKRFDGVPFGEALIDQVIDVLGATAARLWPIWYTDRDFSALRLVELGHGKTTEALLADLPGASPTWFAWAARRVLAEHTLGRGAFARETALQQLVLAISRDGLVLVIAATDTAPAPGRLLGLAHAAQWLSRHGPAVIVLLPAGLAGHPELAALSARPTKPCTPLAAMPAVTAAHEANRATGDPAAAIPPMQPPDAESVWLWPLTGRPHPLSDGEQRLAIAIRRDAELKPLFTFNRRVTTIYQSDLIVDLLWAEGRLVVEVDGVSHRQAGQYAADRQRDFELLVSGYLVLRMLNEEILIDTERSLEKIRKVVAFRRHANLEITVA